MNLMKMTRADLIELGYEQLFEQRRRLELLRDQMRRLGVQHFDQGNWFSQFHGHHSVSRLNETFYEGIDKHDLIRADFDISNCGAAACLAGHGAIVMLNQPGVTDCSRFDVAEYFGIPQGWFDSRLHSDHPYDELSDRIYQATEDEQLGYWVAQLAGVSCLIDMVTDAIIYTPEDVEVYADQVEAF